MGGILTYLLVGFVAVLVLGVVLSVIGAMFGLAFGLAALLLKLAPIILLGYVVVRFLGPKKKRLSEADRKWLES
jgi:hypothetical protein